MAAAVDASPPTQQPGSIRRRGTLETITKSATEDQALNEIAREAEVRLAAKRAARAEARSIRMKEIEREQKNEGGEEDEEEFVEEEESPKEKKTLSRGNTLRERINSVTSRRTSTDAGDAPPGLSPENEIVELKALIKVEEAKYKKAMVNNAQLDNERQALQYQVEMLRDAIEELQEGLTNKEDELMHKSRDYSKLSREHQNTCADLSKSLYIITERERVLDEHGINLDGSVKEGYGSPSPSGLCSSCGGAVSDTQNEQSLLAEISSLRSELDDLRQESRSEASVNVLESIQTEHSELDQSFADVSNEAAVIRDDALHTGLYVNNNEKNDDFEMIDNGGQQDGMRHFEDQSYEKSSSLTSSMMTDTATSIESSLPLEINVEDNQGSAPGKDDYDIVQVDDSKSSKPIDINVNSYTNVDYGPSISSSSGSITSSINVNKYFCDDRNNTPTEEPEEYSVFSVNRYFASESPEHTAASRSNSHKPEDNIEVQTSVDTITNVQSDYDTIDTEDVYSNVESKFVCEENHDSPYEDVQEESAQLANPTSDHHMVIIDDETASLEKTSSIEAGDLSKSNTLEGAKNVDVSEMTVLQTHIDTDFTSQSPEQFNATVEVLSPAGMPKSAQGVKSEESSAPEGEVTDLDRSDSQIESSIVASVIPGSERDLVNGDFDEAPASPSVSNDKSESVAKGESTNEEQEIIRHDVEDLYNQIAEETKEDTEPEETGEPTVTWEVECETSPKAPEISVVDTDPTAGGVDEDTATPKAKERKSKKKKKKGDKVTTVEMVENEDPALGSVVLTDPLLLGYAEPEKPPQPAEEEPQKPATKSSEKANRSKSDIPKQFLDASADLIGTSGSDLSDLDDGDLSDDGEGEGKRKNSKRSKKDGCKSQ